MQVGISSKDDRSLSLREVYGEKLGSFLEAKESCYRCWDRSESPGKLWRALQEEKEHYLFQLVSSGLRFSEKVQNEVDWRDMFDLLQKSELSLEYPFSLPYGSATRGGVAAEISESEVQLMGNQFSPKWGISAGKSGYQRVDKRRVGDKTKKAPFVMDERQWQLAGYEVVLLCIEFIRHNMGELRLQITRLEDRRLRMESAEEQNRGGSGTYKRGGSGQQGRFSSTAEEKAEHCNFSRLCSDQGDDYYDRLQSLRSKLTRDCDNLTSIYKSLMMFSEMARIKFRIDSCTDYLIGILSSRFDSGGMGFFSSEDIHPLEVRYRVLLLIESWSKSDMQSCRSSTWEHGKLRIKPGGAPRIVPELSSSRTLKDDPEFRAWIHRQIHIIYSNLAFKLQRLVVFIPPGWLQYLPGEIDLRDMLDLKSKSWSYGDKTIGPGINKELLSEGVQKSLGRNPQTLLEFALESISILDKLRVMVDLGFWGDLSYLKSIDHKVNGRDLLNRLLKILSEMEKLDLVIRRDVSQNSLKSVSPTFHINLSSYCVDFLGNKDKTLISSKANQNKQDSHAYINLGTSGTGNMQLPGSSQLDLKEHLGYINKRQLIYSNELVRDSIEERLLALPSLSSYWMLESQVVHVLIRTLMTINVSSVDPESVAIRGAGLASMGLHQYSPFISRCIVFTGYMLENGIFVDEDLEYLNKLTVTSRTNIIPTSMETYSLYLASSIWTCYENFLSYNNLRSVSGTRPEVGHESPLGADTSGLRTGEPDSSSIQDALFSVLDLVLRDLPGFLKYQTVSSLEEDLSCSSSQPLHNAYFSISQPPGQKSLTGGSGTVSKEALKPVGSNVRSRFHSNSRELLRKITSSRETKGASADKSLKESKEEELDEDIAHLNNFYKISSFLVQIQGRRPNSNSNAVLSQPILRQSDQLWRSPDWMVSLGGAAKGERSRRKEETLSDQLWRVFGISLTTSSRAERVYGEILVRRMNTLFFRSRILCLCQNFFRLGAPRILRKLLQIVSRVNTFLALDDDENLSAATRRANMGQIGPDKRLWTRYCNYCILRSNELKIRELFEVPMQMLRLPATHYVELKLRLKSRDIRESQEKERMERLARQEIQGCLETFIHSFQFLKDVHIWETITGWSRVMYEGASLTAGGGSISLVRDYVLITVRLLEVYVPYYMQELMSSEYWDLIMVPKSQFEDLVSSIIAIDKYMVILRNWLEFNLDSVKIQSRIIDAQMMYNQPSSGGGSNSHAELKLQEMMRRRYLNDHLQPVTLLSLFSSQFILLVQNRISNIEHLVYKVYRSNQDGLPGTSAWITGINPPDIYTSSIMIDIGTIVNTGVESLVEWLIFPLEDEQSLTLCLSPIMKFYIDITTFVVNTIKKELCCKKYEMVDSYLQYTMDILSVLSKNGAGMNGSSLGTCLTQELRNLIKIHNIPSLVRQVLSFSNACSSNTGTGMTTIMNSGNGNAGGGNSGSINNNSSMSMNNSGAGGDLLGIGSGSKLGAASWNRNKSKLAVEGCWRGGVSEAMLAEKFERGSLFFSLLNLCLRLEDEEKGGDGGGVDGGRSRRSAGDRNMAKSEERYLSDKAGTSCTRVNIASTCTNYVDTQDLKFLVSIHNLFFFKDIIFETSSKIFSLFFGQGFASVDNDRDQDLGKKHRVQNGDDDLENAVSACGRRNKQRGGNSGPEVGSFAPVGGSDQKPGVVSNYFSRQMIDQQQEEGDLSGKQYYRLPDEVLVKMKKMLEFLRNYGAMDNDENKLLASESTAELNRLLFSQGTGSVFAEPQALKRHMDLFLNLLGECIQSIDSLVAYIFRMYCIKTISCTFGVEFYLRIYGTGLLNGIQNQNNRGVDLGDANRKCSYSYTSSYEEEAVLSLESLIPGLNSCFRDFLSQCCSARMNIISQGRGEEESGRNPDVSAEGGEIFSLFSKGLSARSSQLEAEFNKEYMRSLELLWLSHIFELSQSKVGIIPSFADEISPLFEYDFEILDELRRSSNVSDYCYYRCPAGKDDTQVKIMASDTILYFITQVLPNKKLMQHKIFKDLALLSTLSSEESAGLLHQKEKGSSNHTSNSKVKTNIQENNTSSNFNCKQGGGTGGWYHQNNKSLRLFASSSHHELENVRLSSNVGARSSRDGDAGGGDLTDYYSSITRQFSKGRPSQIVSKIIKNSHSGQKKIRDFISKSLSNH